MQLFARDPRVLTRMCQPSQASVSSRTFEPMLRNSARFAALGIKEQASILPCWYGVVIIGKAGMAQLSILQPACTVMYIGPASCHPGLDSSHTEIACWRSRCTISDGCQVWS